MGSFIPRQYATEQITIRVDSDVLAQVEQAAARYNLSRNAFINQCIRYALDNMAPPQEKMEEMEKE